MNKEIQRAIENGECILLLGAGAASGSKNRFGKDILMGDGLSELLCEKTNIPYECDKLPDVYTIANKKLGSKLRTILEEQFSNVTPSAELNAIARIPWARIYSLNIDDAIETAFRNHSGRAVSVKTASSTWKEIDQTFQSIDIIKLNGCINTHGSDLIFSTSQYASAANTPPEWYKQLGRDYLNYTFVFIGTKLKEPLFYQQLEYYKNCWSGSQNGGQAFLITPEISELDRLALEVENIQHVIGNTRDFANWLKSNIPNELNHSTVASRKNPGFEFSYGTKTSHDDLKIIRIDGLIKAEFDKKHGKTREFYLGFKPTWDEILDGVPAELSFHRDFEKNINTESRIHVIVGPAGSGKSTALMMLAKKLSISGKNVFYLKEPVAGLKTQISKLENNISEPYYVFIDKASSVTDGIISSLDDKDIRNVVFVCGERSNVWKNRTSRTLNKYKPTITNISTITRPDANKILEKLEEFGPWSRVAKLNQNQRIDELLKKSKKQLLIGLMELTTGYGFEKIIEDDFQSIDSEDGKLFLILIGLATVHGLGFPKDLCLAALSNFKNKVHIDNLLSSTHGIVSLDGSILRARHPVYMDKLFDGKIKMESKDEALRALLMAMTRNERPISKNLPRSELMLFKLSINHNFIKNLLHNIKDFIIPIFEDFEKHFELDGLFYLQYGLSLRNFEMHDRALSILRSATDAWAMKQTEHAYAQQLLICAKLAGKENAYRNLEEAREILLRLDTKYIEDDSDYPLVTLAEHHVDLVKKFDTQDELTRIADYYIRALTERKRTSNNYRITDAIKKILRTATIKPSRTRLAP